jgi:hypothetical protein
MHVSSFVTGRRCVVVFFESVCGVLVILSLTWRLRGSHRPRWIDWRFDGCVFFVLCVVGHLVLGLVSGLEAFSREPPCDSVGALVVRQTP